MKSKEKQYNGIVVGDANENCIIYKDCVINQGIADRCMELADKGDFEDVQNILNNTVQAISTKHPLFPDYLFELQSKNNKTMLLSKPYTEDAIKKYPPQVKCKAKIEIGDKDIGVIGVNYEDYANRHQLPMTVHILDAKKMLGDYLDPIQVEAEELVGKTKIFPPKPFPEAQPCSLLIDNEMEYEYILLRIQEIMDDGTIIMSNREQKGLAFKLWLSVRLSDNKTDFKISLEHPTNRDLLKYNYFMSKISQGSKITINVLAVQEPMFEGCINEFVCETPFNSIDEEIKFLEDVILVEDFLKKKIEIAENILESDLENLEYIKNFALGKENNLSWKSCSFEMKLTSQNKEMLLKEDNKPKIISYVGEITLSLFESEYTFKVKRTFEKAYINNLEKLKEKVKVLDEDDLLRIDFIPEKDGGEGNAIDSLEK